MIIYKCQCGDELQMSENTEKSRKTKEEWKKKHSAPMIQKSPKRKAVDKGRATVHGYRRLTVRSH